MPGEHVQQARLAGVRPAGNHDHAAFLQQAALLGALCERAELAAERGQPGADARLAERLDILLTEVDRRLDLNAQIHERRFERVDARRQLAFKRTQRGPRRGRGCGVDQVGDRLRLGEIELVVQKGAF